MESESENGIQNLLSRVLEKVSAKTFEAKNMLSGETETFNMTFSMGVASYTDDSHELDELIEQADQAVYSAKHNGRNQVVFYDGCETHLAK